MNSWKCTRVLRFTGTTATEGAAQNGDPASYIARIEGRQSPNRQGWDPYTIQELMQRFRIPGVSIAVIQDFKIHWAKGYGLADAQTAQPVDTGTAFQAASISKPVFAMAMVKLQQDGRLSLENGAFTLPLNAGDNDVVVAVANAFFGWGLILRLDDAAGVRLTTSTR